MSRPIFIRILGFADEMKQTKDLIRRGDEIFKTVYHSGEIKSMQEMYYSSMADGGVKCKFHFNAQPYFAYLVVIFSGNRNP